MEKIVTDEPIIKKKTVEKEVVQVTIELDKAFYDSMMRAKADVAESRGFDVALGNYIQEAMEDLVKMIDATLKDLNSANATIQYLKGIPKVVQKPKIEQEVVESTKPPYSSMESNDDPMYI